MSDSNVFMQGQARITYDDPPSAEAAIKWFDGGWEWSIDYIIMCCLNLQEKISVALISKFNSQCGMVNVRSRLREHPNNMYVL